MTNDKFITHLRVRHYEIDAIGYVNNAVYPSYLEQAAIEHSEHLGITLERYQVPQRTPKKRTTNKTARLPNKKFIQKRATS